MPILECLETWNSQAYGGCASEAQPQPADAQTLRAIWEAQGLLPIVVAARAMISLPTLYKLNRKERCSERSIRSICDALHITRPRYDRCVPDHSTR